MTLNPMILIAAGCLAATPILLPLQDAKPEAAADGFTSSARVRFAMLQYNDGAGQTQSVAARNIREVRLVKLSDQDLRLELLYHNGDYSLIALGTMHFISKADGMPSEEVLVTRTTSAGIRFPLVN